MLPQRFCLGFIGVLVSGLFLSGCSDATSSSAVRQDPGSLAVGVKPQAQRIDVELSSNAELLTPTSISVTLRARCPSGFRVVEGIIGVMQGPEFQEVFGEGFFTTPCNGRWQRRTARVDAPDGIQAGRARASATLMVEHPATGEFLQGDDRVILKIR